MSEDGARVVLRIGARELVAFSMAAGDLHRRRFGAAPTALEGIWGHQRVQRSRPKGYEAEVTVRHTHAYDAFDLEVGGRIDGVFTRAEPIVVEEIKTTRAPFEEIAPESRALHMAQGKLYAHLYALDHRLDSATVQLTYLNLDNHKTEITREHFTASELRAFFDDLARTYLEWAVALYQWRLTRDQSLQDLAFPFTTYRQGQRRLAGAVYRTIQKGTRLFVEAPTGIGKTAGILYPGLKALGENRFDKLFFLTAKTVGRKVAEHTLAVMRERGMKLKSVTLTARDKICFDAPCDPETCPFAIGYYDRLRAALWDALQHREVLDRGAVLELAEAHSVCPFELSLDLAAWADVVICDFNYVFDPGAYLRRFFGEKDNPHTLLVDEAHNLADRARDSFSAELDKGEVLAVKRLIQNLHPDSARGLAGVNRHLLTQRKSMEREELATPDLPEKLLTGLQRFCKAMESWLATGERDPVPPRALDLYLEARRFLRTAEYYRRHREAYATLLKMKGKSLRIRLNCIDPAPFADAILSQVHASVFFSATLTPFPYFQRLLGSPGYGRLYLESPFPPANLCLTLVHTISTRYRDRESSCSVLVRLIAGTLSRRKGNYLVFFPSYAYLRAVYERFRETYPEYETLVQEPGMDEAARDAFLARFDAQSGDTLAGFAVMGGLFGEGIDLTGDRLIGVVVVGVGLPSLCLERDLIRDYFDEGYAYAYQIPGWHRVLQTAGRVIRTETDRGVVVLIDERFAHARYRELFPSHWQPVLVDGPETLGGTLTSFWERG